MLEWITEIGPERVGGLITDNAANIKLGRELTVLTYGFTNILERRWAGLQNTHTRDFSTATPTQSAAQEDVDSCSERCCVIAQVHDARIQPDSGLTAGTSMGEGACQACAKAGHLLPG